MSVLINSESALLDDSDTEPLIPIPTNKKLHRIHLFLIILIVLSSLILIAMTISLIEYNIVLHHFNGINGIGTYINKSTIVVDELSNIIKHTNETEVKEYIHKLMVIIDKICGQVGCRSLDLN
tara:strand:- start:409 stop:777 length:369 start_codon:yes stop_codon:yes gene_type:complete